MISKRKFRRATKPSFSKGTSPIAGDTRVDCETTLASSWFTTPHEAKLVGRERLPRATRLKEFCAKIGWRYEELFQVESLADELFEEEYLNLEKLTQRYLRLAPRDPLKAWGH